MTAPSTFTPDLIAALAAFAFVASITPGPNNAMLMASGANYGFLRTAPHIAGVWIGFAVLLAAVAAGLGGLFTASPALHRVLQAAGAADHDIARLEIPMDDFFLVGVFKGVGQLQHPVLDRHPVEDSIGLGGGNGGEIRAIDIFQ